MASNRLGVISLIIIVAVTCSSMQEIHAKPPVQIVEGDDATIEEFPWLVSLRDYLKRHYCGGSLISNKHVLTAAHCVVKFSKGRATYDYVLSPSRITVQTGSSNSSEYKNAHKVEKIYVHEHFTLPGLGVWTRDIAIITLKHPIEPNSYQRPIALPSTNVEAGETGQLAGWGLTAEDVMLPSETLKKAVMTIWSDHRCRSTLRGYTPRHQLCAYNNERVGFCDGDSGGSLVVNNQIVGLVSNSIRCSGPYPYIYTNVFNYLDWINGILQADE